MVFSLILFKALQQRQIFFSEKDMMILDALLMQMQVYNMVSLTKRLRATGFLSYKFNNVSRAFLSLAGGVTVNQFNALQPIRPFVNTISTLFFEDNYAKFYERQFIQLGFSEELFNGFRLNSSLSFEKRKALFNTTNQTFINDDK